MITSPHSRRQSFRRTLVRFCLRIAMLIAGVIGWDATTHAQQTPQELTAQIVEPSPQQDDATIRDVALIGESLIWAVGDRGVIWRSTDGGASWEFLSLSEKLERYSLRSVYFLTDRVGWIAGGTVLPIGGTSQGIVLATQNGGKTWSVERSMILPYLQKIQFFDLENGIAAGERSTDFPSGVLITTDGGQTWSPAPAEKSGRWKTAAFTSPQEGIVAGDQGAMAVLARGSVLDHSVATRGLRSLQGLSLDLSGRAWMVGDGAAVYRSNNNGVSWEPLRVRLPEELEDFTNFRSVSHIGDQCWLVGSPGSVVWHSDDAGNTWIPQATGESIPLEVVRFADPRRGVAAGHLGRICITRDGGQSWQTVRGANRRLAVLAVQTHIEQTALPFLTRWSREEGYRSAVLIATRRDTGRDAHTTEELPLRLAHATQTAGGNAAWIDWRLPLELPSLERNRDQLLKEWTDLTDRRLPEILLESLVAEIRIWRPSLLLISEPDEGEFATELLQKAISRAMEQAADPTFALDQQQFAGLAPWSVKKLVLQRRPGGRSGISLDPLEVLPRIGTTLDLAAADALGQLHVRQNVIVERQQFEVLRTTGTPPLSNQNLFGDLALVPNSEARRPQITITSLDYDRLLSQAQHRRTITAISQRASSSPEQAGRLLGQLQEIIAPLTPEQAAQQLAALGQLYHENGQWGLAESVYAELITRYPDQRPAVDAMLWLMKYWTSAEMNWQRLRTMRATGTLVRGGGMGGGIAQAKLEEAIQIFRDQKTKTAAALSTPELSAPVNVDSRPLTPQIGTLQSVVNQDGTGASQYQMQLNRWQTAAASVARGMQEAYPQLFEKPEMQFTLAALARRRSEHRKADDIYSRFMKTISDDPWNIAARGEAYLLRPGAQSPKPVIACKSTRTPPVLDGVLSDPCWKDAIEVRLGEQENRETYIGPGASDTGNTTSLGAQPIAFLAHDDRFLYIAVSVPIHDQLPADPPELAGRQHDADLDGFDLISLQLDVDRDYGTFYRFDIDQRGHTREACWDNWAYNPKWYCAAVRDLDAWRIECAIPLEELLPPERIVGTSWGVGITRILPGIGSQSWTDSGAEIPHPAKFGLMRFE